jgi:glycosyltransferase involved in cell wall biosynthesis
MSPEVTIGLPCHNAADTVGWALDSVLAQTFGDWELVAVDDGSTDATPEILAQVDDARVRVVRHHERAGLAARLNEIADQANGDLMARMDADDIMFPERIERQVQFFGQQPETDLLGTGIVSIDLENRMGGVRCTPAAVDTAARVFAGDVLFHPTVMGRAAWFREHHYDEGFARSQDFELWCRTAGEAVIRNLPEPLLFYREAGQLDWRKYAEHSRITRAVIRRHGPSRIGRGRSLRLRWGRRCKDVVYWLLFKAGCADRVVRLRNRELPNEERQCYEALLGRIVAGQQNDQRTT